MMARGRGRLSNIQLLPRECEGVVAWAAQELQNSDRTQTDIYQEFYIKLEALQAEYHGELEFSIPSFQAFNRYSMRLAVFAAEIEQAREMTKAIASRFDAEGEDDLARMGAMAIKSLVTNIIASRGSKNILPKEAMSLANALRAAAQAEGISTARRLKVEKEFADKVEETVETVAKVAGLSQERAAEIRKQVLGLRS